MRVQDVTAATPRISAEHVDAYRRDGFAVVRGVFGRGEVAALVQAFDRQRSSALAKGRSWRHGISF